MLIHCLGISHHTANVDLRELLAFNEHTLRSTLSKFCGQNETSRSIGSISEMVILSTCNRVEIYAVADELIFDALEGIFLNRSKLTFEEIRPALYPLSGEQAIAHLFKVAAGLDSMVLGEPQILGQISEAFEIAHSVNTSGKILSRLFQMATHSGKRARTETAIGHNATSVPSLAVRRATKAISNLEKAKIVLLGAGEMTELAVEALHKRGAINFHFISRTLSHAQKLADRWQGEADRLETLPLALRRADILITSSNSSHILVDRQMVAEAMDTRPNRPMNIVDIAVPRDVATEVGELPGVQLYDIDNLKQGVEESLEARQREVPKVEAILIEEQSKFMDYLASLDIIPVIIEMRAQAENIRNTELEKVFRRLPDLTLKGQEGIAALTQSIVKKMLHSPTTRLRASSIEPESDQLANAARALFGLDNPRNSINGSEND